MFTFCPLLGAKSESTASQSLLELDGGVKVLIDVGWDESFDAEKLRELEKQVPTISLVLLTHATVSHIAAFAHCCKNFPQFVRIPIFATKPVIDLGRTLLQDLYASTPLAASTIPRGSLAEASYSYSQSLSAEHSQFLLQAPTADEITRYFSLIRELKYSQPHQPQAPPSLPPLNGLTITAYNSGRTLGGTIWHIQLGLESIVYGVDWGQYKENVFSGAAWIGGGGSGGSEVNEQLRKPTALVSSSRAPAVLRPGLRDEQLLQAIRVCVARGGTVLIPVDSSARVLELAYLLEHAWRKDAAAAAAGSNGKEDIGLLARSKLFLAGRTSGSLMRHARTLLEWMNDGIVQEFEAVADGSKQQTNNGGNRGRGGGGGGGGGGGNGADDNKNRESGPFDMKHLRLLERRAQVERVLNSQSPPGGGKVILASDASMEWGFSKEVLRRIADKPRNLVLLTEVPGVLSANKRSLARTLWEWWKSEQGQEAASSGGGGNPVRAGGRHLQFQDGLKVALDGAELLLYQQWLATQRQLQATLQTGGPTSLEAFADAGDDVSSSSSSSSSDDDEQSDSERQGKVLNISTTIGQASRKKVVLRDEDLGVTILIKRKGHYDFDVRGKKGRERVFPVAVRRKRNDDFGELIRADEYLREEEREEDGKGGESGEGGGLGRQQQMNQQDGLGKKRKWDDIVSGVGTRGRSRTDERTRGWGPGLRQGRADERDDGDEANRDGREEAEEEEEDEEDEEQRLQQEQQQQLVGPAKMVFTTETVVAQMAIGYVDFSGLHTDRNLEMLLPLVEPRKLILVGGSAVETEAAATRYRNVVSKQRGVAAEDVDVFSPAVGAAVDASVDTHAWVVRLADALVKKLRWQNLGGLGIVTLTGQLQVEGGGGGGGGGGGENTASTEDSLASGDGGLVKRPKMEAKGAVVATSSTSLGDALPTLDVLPTGVAAAARGAGTQPLHVGELQLTNLRRAMQNAGHTAEFRGEGTLVIDGSVAVRKTAAGRVELESIGLPSDGGPATRQGGTFYAVKRMIYEGLAVVAGG
ncbi:polyadenylation specificity factor [Grosmannia clavigera kw1407]|uniref:Cleavage and polyadenylation specificity factor subunit 2 n=1 Tax=Grosmannia clavigera (strain kw1407 / UAMH 11150) TaxID=655863 RepID=F0XFZ6_GROCL|nr:polyadenylation specificity factor [Grosmannia clavigera kw1407]EFX03384.1 polyadenylation specificity factor [Grosmannia clavigera kw1407]